MPFHFIRKNNSDAFPKILTGAQLGLSKIDSLSNYIHTLESKMELDGFLITANEILNEQLDTGEYWRGYEHGIHIGYVINRNTLKRLKAYQWCNNNLTNDHFLHLYYVNLLAASELLEEYNLNVDIHLPNRISLCGKTIGIVHITVKTNGRLIEHITTVISINPPYTIENTSCPDIKNSPINNFRFRNAYGSIEYLINKYFNILLTRYHDGKRLIATAIVDRSKLRGKKVKVETIDGRTYKGIFMGIDPAVGLPIIESNGRRAIISNTPKIISILG